MNTTATDSALPVPALKWWIFGVSIAALLISYLGLRVWAYWRARS